MKKRFLLFGIALATMVTSCYGPNDSVYTEDLDVVYTQKKDGYDFTSKVNFHVSDTVTYVDSKGKPFKSPNEGGSYEKLSKKEVEALVGNVKSSMKLLGWDENTSVDPDDATTFENTALMNIVISKTTYVGGGYYPWYGYGYYNPWYPVYYTYSTGSAIVNMFELNADPKVGDGPFDMIWETFLSGYIRNGIDVHYVNQGIQQGFRQSQDYLKR